MNLREPSFVKFQTVILTLRNLLLTGFFFFQSLKDNQWGSLCIYQNLPLGWDLQQKSRDLGPQTFLTVAQIVQGHPARVETKS